VEQWQNAPHYYRLDTGATKAVQVGKQVLDIQVGGYSHYLDMDLSLHTLRHYKTYFFPNNGGYAVVGGDRVE